MIETESRAGIDAEVRGRAVLFALIGVLVAGCGGAPASNGPSGSSPSPRSSAAATTPPQGDGVQVVGAFLSLTQAADRSMHMELSGQVVIAGTDPQTLTAAYDMQGADFAGQTTIQAPVFGSFKTQVIVVDGQTFTNTLDRGWGAETTPRPAQDPFTGLQPADVAYVGPDTVAGAPGYRLRMQDPVGAFVRAMGGSASVGFTDIVVKSASYDVLVDAEGRPVSAAFTLEATTREAGDISVSMSYTFSQWGAQFTIAAPIDLPPTEQPGAVLTVYNRYLEAIVLRDKNGLELAAPACGVASAETFAVDAQFDIVSATGSVVGSVFPDSDPQVKIRYLEIGPGFTSQGADPMGPLEPCAALPTAP
jgi:hypothetical protein